jgi:hypothetical protein
MTPHPQQEYIITEKEWQILYAAVPKEEEATLHKIRSRKSPTPAAPKPEDGGKRNAKMNNEYGFMEDFVLAIGLLCFAGFVIGFVFGVYP